MEQKVKIGKKSSDLEPGYVWAPYIPMVTSATVVEYGYKNTSRKRKINKIFNLGLYIKDDIFSTSKSLSSRYSAVQISDPYKTIFIDNNMV
jgi:hypothetical protein